VKFEVTGTMKAGGNVRPFVKEIEAGSEERAREVAYQRIGADHHIGREKVKIKSVEKMEDGKH